MNDTPSPEDLDRDPLRGLPKPTEGPGRGMKVKVYGAHEVARLLRFWAGQIDKPAEEIGYEIDAQLAETIFTQPRPGPPDGFPPVTVARHFCLSILER